MKIVLKAPRGQSSWQRWPFKWSHTALTDNRGKTRQLSIALVVLLALSIIPALFFREPWLWMDEVLSYLLVSDPSYAHLNDSVVSNMDANPPVFPAIYWLLGHAVSLDPLFLQAFSAVLFIGTLVLFYRFTTRLVGDPVTNFVLITAMVYLTYQNFVHATEIRSYALVLPVSLVYFILMHRLIREPANGKVLLLHTLVGTLLAFCHNYGLFYLAASGAFFLFLFIWSKQWAYLRILISHLVVGAVWLLVWYPSFKIQSFAGQPHSWIPYPTFHSFFYAVGELMPSLSDRLERQPGYWWVRVLRVSAVVGLLVALSLTQAKAGFVDLMRHPARQFFLMAGFVWLTTLLIALTVSLTFTSVLLSRYMWPSQLLIVYQLLYAYHHLAGPRPLLARLSPLLGMYGLLLGGVIFYKVWKMQSPFPSRILRYLPELRGAYPVFVERADYFLPLWHHGLRPGVSYVLDWQTATRPGNILSATTDYKILSSVRQKYNVPGIMPSRQFTAAAFPHFYVVDEAGVYQFEDYIKRGRIKVVREFPIAMPGHRLLECTF